MPEEIPAALLTVIEVEPCDSPEVTAVLPAMLWRPMKRLWPFKFMKVDIGPAPRKVTFLPYKSMSPASVLVPAGRLITEPLDGLLQEFMALLIAEAVAPELRVVQIVERTG